MTSHRPDPLTPEERELAERLARIGPHGMPSPALDARILGAAQTAIARGATTPARRRWPAWLGVAATLALALGAVWQLRPVREMPVALDEAPSSAVMRRPPVAVEEMRPATAAPPEPRELAPPKASPLPPPPVVFDDPSPVDTPAPLAAPAPPAPPPPPPPHAEKARSAPATAPMQRHRSEPQDTAMARRSMAAAEAAMESAASAAPTAGAGTGSDTIVTVTDLPVASDRLLPPEDWIERIRQRREAGDFASARASLALLRQDHPHLALPEDVLTIPAPAPPPDR